MKKFYSFLFAAVALVGFAACNSDSTEEPAPAQKENVGKMEFMANIGEETKTQLTEGKKVKWCAEDAIAVSNGTDVEKYTIKEGSLSADGKTAIFEGKVLEGDTYYAVYPWTEDAAYTDGTWNVTEPQKQTAVAGSFADGAAVSYGTYQGEGKFSFTNESAILKFLVPEDCSFVQFYNGSELAVELDGELKAGETYYAAVAPGQYTFTVRIDAYLSKKSKKVLDLEKNTIYNIKTLPAPEECEWGLVGQHQNWSLTNANLTRLYKEADNLFVVKNIKLVNTGFKFTELTNTNWNLTFGSHSSSYVYSVTDGWYKGIYTNNRGDKDQDIKVSDWNKTYDVYLRYVQSADWGKELGFAIVEAGQAYPELN